MNSWELENSLASIPDGNVGADNSCVPQPYRLTHRRPFIDGVIFFIFCWSLSGRMFVCLCVCVVSMLSNITLIVLCQCAQLSVWFGDVKGHERQAAVVVVFSVT